MNCKYSYLRTIIKFKKKCSYRKIFLIEDTVNLICHVNRIYNTFVRQNFE